ncbi:MAG: CDP-diacylglycerol--glycerol-3-phosphate 3-phosphatidyltransferase [Rhodovibrionaceae bacterium]
MAQSLPNLLTAARIVAIPLIVGLLFLDGGVARWAAFVIFVGAAVTDYFDGLAARRLKVVTPLGRFLDPIADKLLVAAVIVALVAVGKLGGWLVAAAILMLCRELLVSGLREYLAELGVPLPVSRLAKWKTTLQLIALGGLIVALPGSFLFWLAEAGFWVATALTLITGWDYLRVGLREMVARS